MKTLIRIFYKSAISNIMSALSYPYDNIVTICFTDIDNYIEYTIKQHQDILAEYNLSAPITLLQYPLHKDKILSLIDNADIDITSNNLNESLTLLSLTNGTNTVFYYDNKDNIFKSIHGDISKLKITNLHIRQAIESYGASVQPDSLHYNPKDFENSADKDILLKIFNIFEPSLSVGSYGLITAFPYAISKAENNIIYIYNNEFTPSKNSNYVLKSLQQIGILEILDIKKGKLKMNTKYLHIFKVMGQILEMYCYITCKESDLFDDVKMSVVIDFDGKYNNENNARSEIDLIVIKNNHPSFVSCKLSKVKQEDIYEIQTNSSTFGGPNNKPFLVVSNKSKNITKYMIDKSSLLNVTLLSQEDLSNLANIISAHL